MTTSYDWLPPSWILLDQELQKSQNQTLDNKMIVSAILIYTLRGLLRHSGIMELLTPLQLSLIHI